MALRDALLPEFDHEMANTRKTLERVPDDKFDWKPHLKSMAMGGLATHLSNLPLGQITQWIKTRWIWRNIHHRAQLGVYLRLNDIPVPSIYGPSADEGAF
jgi:uncharacterized damage-inducible protein DinB